ncbi:receptor-type tyrosine-protein phosphatase kappa-like isoform X2 [Dermacentor andersoni]|uniref:receptor-type tyrosine-protein phosphatase kappa-like isoform X2 n=1 Tax=Dermacentor andersoni TaxID=34620 RepID=UPI00241720E1|nr:receptor-type tyrosine-protein phosphatase kappa-like isoform X3 [Dermacentor andersoni]
MTSLARTYAGTNESGKSTVNGTLANGHRGVAARPAEMVDVPGDEGDSNGKVTLVIHKYETPPGAEKQHVVPTEDLERYVTAMKESGGFKEQLATLKTGQQKPWTVAQKPENKHKNRYADLLPYDDTRVILYPLKNDPSSDYINANYINGYRKPKAYICTQETRTNGTAFISLSLSESKTDAERKKILGAIPLCEDGSRGPVEKTVQDFWRMVWQEEICKFIMAANLVEDGKPIRITTGISRKVERYWPETCSKYGDIMVTLVSEEVFVDYSIRTFKVHKSGAASKRVVKQFHFTAWPDHGVPAHPLSLVEMIELAKAHAPSSKAPLLLHCSAGVGRTGTIVLMEAALDMARAEKRVDVMGLLYKLRQQRVNLVETAEQYEFVHVALLERLFGEPTRQPRGSLAAYFNRLQLEKAGGTTDLERQYEKLKQLSPPLPSEKCKFALINENRLKNRSIEILPDEDGRPILGAGASSVYVNAVYTNGYASKRTYIVTQYPLIITVEDFWQLVYDSGSQTIVLLNDVDAKDETCPVFWPHTGSMHHRHLRVDHVSTDVVTGGVLQRRFKLRNTAKSPKSRLLKQFHLQGWRKGDVAPPSVDLLVRLLGKVERWQRKCTPEKPTVVACFNGATASGLFCAASFLSDQLKAERHADILMAARTVRQHRPTFLPCLNQYRLLYEVACALATPKHSKLR